MTTIGNLPVRTRLPLTAWVLAGLVALLSLVQTNVESGPPILLEAGTTNQATASANADLLDVLWP